MKLISRVGIRSICLLAMVLLLPACSTLGLVDEAPAPQPDLVGDRPDEVNWSFANANALNSEIAQLKSENDQLKKAVKSLRLGKEKAEKLVLALSQGKSPEQPAVGTLRKMTTDKKPTVSVGTVVAAANADKALADAPPLIDNSPRLVQPSFSDETPEFENEAASGSIQMSSVLYGVHLASYKSVQHARVGWNELQREFPDELGLLEPRIEEVNIPERGVFLRLIGGGFSSEGKASVLCQRLKGKGRYCATAGFNGSKLMVSDTAG